MPERPTRRVLHPSAVALAAALNLMLSPSARGLPPGQAHQQDAQRTAVAASASIRTPEDDTLRLTLERAEAVALEGSPFLRAARRRERIARGNRRQAGVYRYNPEFGYDVKTVQPPSGQATTARFEASVAQELEWAGQWGLREDAAERGVEGALAGIADAERRALRDVRRAFWRAAGAERKVDVARRMAELGQRLRNAVRRQKAAGEVSALDVNLAEIEYGRMRGRVLTARRGRRSAFYELKRILGLDPDDPVSLAAEGDVRAAPTNGSPVGATPADETGAEGPSAVHPPGPALPDPEGLSLDSLAEAALARRPDLLGAEAEIARANVRRRLARREAIPNLVLSVPVERDAAGGTTDVGLGVGLSFPLWNRNQGTADAREAELARARDRREGVLLRVRTEVRDALQAYRSATEEARTLQASVLGPALRNQELLETSYEAGKIDLPTLLLLRGRLLDDELAYWDAWLARRSAWADLKAAVGEPTDLAIRTGDDR